MKPKKFSFDPDNTDDNGIWTVASIAGAGALTMNGALVSGGVATMDYARRIGIISAGDDSLDTMTFVGTDQDDKAQTEVVTMANAGTAESTKYFKTITSATASGASAGNVTIGTVDEFCSQTIPLDARSREFATRLINTTGAIAYQLQETMDDIQSTPTVVQDAAWSDVSASGEITAGATACKLLVTSFTDTAEITMNLNQALS
jgi:hypothetical protein